MDPRTYADLLSLQSGVVSRRQLSVSGAAPHDIERMLRRRELVRVHDGVFVDHTGQPSWMQRAWAGVLAVWPSALAADSALRAADGAGRSGRDDAIIQLAVDRHRRVRAPAGCRLHRVARLEEKVLWNASPPRLRVEEALLDVASGTKDDFGAISVLADAVQSRRTVPARLRTHLDARPWVRRREFLAGVLTDLELGACSVLEHGYLTLVERPHGLPVARRQVRDSLRGSLYRDVVYDIGPGQLVELDGRLWHDNATARDADLDRDLDAAVAGQHTIRLGWGQVYGRPCATAVRVGAVLGDLGWSEQVQLCPSCPRDWLLTG